MINDSLLDLISAMPPSKEEDLHDLWGLYRDGTRFRSLISLLTKPFEERNLTKIVGVEARGLLLGGAAAMYLGIGFVPVRKAGGYLPGPKLCVQSKMDWAGKVNDFEIQKDALSAGDRVALVDDWYTTGSQAQAAIHLIELLGAEFVGASVIAEEGDPALDKIDGLSALLRWSARDCRFCVSPFNRYS